MKRKARFLRLVMLSAIIAGGLSLSSCESYSWAKPEIPQDLTVSFSESLMPFCQGCHGSWSTERTYDKLFANVDTVTPASSRVTRPCATGSSAAQSPPGNALARARFTVMSWPAFIRPAAGAITALAAAMIWAVER